MSTAVEVVVCARNSYFPDDVMARCFVCFSRVFHRPYTSFPLEGYLCLDCAFKRIAASGIKVVTTKKAIEEAVEWIAKNR